MTDMIRKSDALAAVHLGDTVTKLQARIAELPAVTVGVIHEEQNTEQARVFWNWLPLAYRDGHLGEEAKFTKYNMEVAHYAGWCAGTRRDNTNAVDDSQPADPVVNAPTSAAIRIADEVCDFFDAKGRHAEAFGAAEVGQRLRDAMQTGPLPADGFATADAEGQWIKDVDAGVYDDAPDPAAIREAALREAAAMVAKRYSHHCWRCDAQQPQVSALVNDILALAKGAAE